jgi:LysM repeat protein
MKTPWFHWLLLAALLSACVPAAVTPEATATIAATRTGEFRPYQTPTATGTPQPPQLSPTPLPSPTPTPRTHSVKLGEDLFGISLRYGVTVEDIKRLNPDVNPNLLTVGMVLLIPASTVLPPNFTPQPTPMNLPVRPPDCWPSAEGGVWCFTLATNDLDGPVESVSAVFRLSAQGEDEIRSQPASAALDWVPAGESVPLLAYFAPPAPRSFTSSVELQGALPSAEDNGRYVPVRLADAQVEIRPDGRSAAVSARADFGESTAGTLRVAAVAYGVGGRIVGVRVLEQAVTAGEPAIIQLVVYSQGAAIERVELLAEARP